MSGEKEIRVKIRSIQSTSKITKAMEMVAASKMKKAQDRVRASRPYADKMRQAIAHVAEANAEYHHPFMVERDIKRVGFIVISSDRGLCGGLNNNLFKNTLIQLSDWDAKGVEIDFAIVGAKAASYFRRIKGQIISEKTHLGEAPTVADLIGSVKVMLDAYDEGRIDRLYLCYNTFVNTMTQEPTIHQLLPIAPMDESEVSHWDYLYEPDAKEVLDVLLDRYIESLVYQAAVENTACEQAARMVAMKAASDNAANLIDELQLVYNKARQASITQEIAEIVAGAAAV